MATLNERKIQIRQQIIKAAEVYSQKLAGKTFKAFIEKCEKETSMLVTLTGINEYNGLHN